MYRFDWFERRKLQPPEARRSGSLRAVSSTVWKLGLTSLLTDISSEMVNSLLPVYLMLYLHMSPFRFGAIDGIYNGIAIAILSLAGGFIADRTRRPKEVAVFGYSISALCKLLLLAAGAAFGWIVAVVALDRTGKGARTAPRDSMISLCTPPESLALAFGVHRALDSVGALFGPIAAFLILSRMPNAFDAVWVASFAFAIVGLSVLTLFVRNPKIDPPAARQSEPRGKIFSSLTSGYFTRLIAIGLLLSAMTLSDGFLYLILQNRSQLAVGFFPLFYVITACCYMLCAIPLGAWADRYGRRLIFFSGYVAIAAIYLSLLLSRGSGYAMIFSCLVLFGFYYAATDGVLTAMASSIIPPEFRTSGLAILATAISAGKFISSLLFGLLWQTSGTQNALAILLAGLAAALLVSAIFLRKNPAFARA